MNSLVNAIKNTVPITQFNRGLAGKIFEDVKKQGAKVVMKNNTPECVLMSPEEYLSLMEEVEDAKLLRLAEFYACGNNSGRGCLPEVRDHGRRPCGF